MRHRARLVTAALACTLALAAGCGDQSAGGPTTGGSSDGSVASASDGTSPGTAIPDDFPLSSGMGGPADTVPTSRSGTGLRDLELCGTSPLRGLGTRDRMVADNSGGESADTRELLVLGAPDDARRLADRLAGLVADCAEPDASRDMETRTEVLASPFGPGPATTLLQTYSFDGEPGTGATIVHVVPVGAALLVTSTYGQWTRERARDAVDATVGAAAEHGRRTGDVRGAPVVHAGSDRGTDRDPEHDSDRVPHRVPHHAVTVGSLVLRRRRPRHRRRRRRPRRPTRPGHPRPLSPPRPPSPPRSRRTSRSASACPRTAATTPSRLPRTTWAWTRSRCAAATSGLPPTGRAPATSTPPCSARSTTTGASSSSTPTPDAAVEAMTEVRRAARDCRRSGIQVWTVLPRDTGYDTVTMGLTYADGLGSSVFQVTRVGSARLMVQTYGEGSLASLDRQADEVTGTTNQIVQSMCAFTKTGC